MEEQTPQKTALSCPHLGIIHDPVSSHAFASSWNCCFYVKHPTVPSFEHQKMFCLTPDHVSCPVYQLKKGSSFPRNLRNKIKPPKPQGANRTYVYIVGVILLLVLAGWLASVMFHLPAKATPALPNPGQGVTTIKITNTAPARMTDVVQLTATSTQAAQITLTPMPDLSTTVITTPVLEIPFKIGDEELVIHRVKDGEGLDYLAKVYNTTPAVIQATNYVLSTPIWVDSIIVIRPGTTNLDPKAPAFQAYQVTDQIITLDKLAQNLNVDLAELKYYNACVERCSLIRGSWVLVPHHK
jgi:hypothetical protein